MNLTTFGERLELRSEVEVTAALDRVWLRLLDLRRHEQWNPFWCHFRGSVELGAVVTFELTPPGGKRLKLRRHVELLEPPNELRWIGGYGFGWLLRSEQYFKLTALAPDRTRLVVGENLRGPGVTGNSNTSMEIARGQALMNQAFKRCLESENS
jgi:hypothetical protein